MAINVDYIKNIITSKKIFIYLIALFAIGVIMLTISKPVDFSKVEQNTETNIQISEETQKDNLEKELEEIISSIAGAGKANVLVIYESTSEKAMSIKESKAPENFIMEKEENDSSEYIAQRMNPRIEGVIRVAEGGGDEFWKREVSESISEILDIELHKVRIHKMKIGD